MSTLSHWTLLRTFAATAVEGTAVPALASLITLPGPVDEDVEISFGAFAATGVLPATALVVSGAPTSIGIWIWAFHDDGTIAVAHPIKIVLAGTDTGVFEPAIIRTSYARLSVIYAVATGGAAPALTGRVHARRVGR